MEPGSGVRRNRRGRGGGGRDLRGAATARPAALGVLGDLGQRVVDRDVDGADHRVGLDAVAEDLDGLAGDPQDFWLHFGDNTIGGSPVRAIENLSTGERRLLEWGGTRLRIDPGDEPALLFRCFPESNS